MPAKWEMWIITLQVFPWNNASASITVSKLIFVINLLSFTEEEWVYSGLHTNVHLRLFTPAEALSYESILNMHLHKTQTSSF